MSVNIIKITYVSYISSCSEVRCKIAYYPTDRDEDYYKERLSIGEPGLWEIVDVDRPNGTFILVPNGELSDGEILLKNYLAKRYSISKLE
jgi:hypothetical protein